MGCAKEQTLNHFKTKGYISDTRAIIDMDKFNNANKYFTNVAVEVHGLSPGEGLLFDIETSEVTVNRGDIIYARKNKIYRAVPKEELFDALDQLIAEKEVREEDALREINDRKGDSKTVYVGEKYTDDPVMHFTTSESYKHGRNRKAKVSNDGFLNQSQDKAFFNKLVAEFETRTGREFDINNKSKEGKNTQTKFYKFLNNKGLKGIEVFDSNNDLHMIRFNFGQPVNFADITMDESMQTNIFAEGITPTEQSISKSQVEDLNWYNEQDLASLYEAFSPAQINQLLAENMDNAAEVFNEYLYGDKELKTRISNREVNDQIKKCK